MIDLDDELDLDLARETAKRPPDKWRPWWKSERPFNGVCVVCGEKVRVEMSGGFFSTHCRFFPTKDSSDTYGEEQAREAVKFYGETAFSFSRSLPDGESP